MALSNLNFIMNKKGMLSNMVDVNLYKTIANAIKGDLNS